MMLIRDEKMNVAPHRKRDARLSRHQSGDDTMDRAIEFVQVARVTAVTRNSED
jgi:hypothetical protein